MAKNRGKKPPRAPRPPRGPVGPASALSSYAALPRAPWRCPWLAEGCRDEDAHDAHADPVEYAARARPLQLELVMTSSPYRWPGHGDVSAKVLAAALARPDLDDALERALVRGVRALDRSYPREGNRAALLEQLLDARPRLGRPAVEELTRLPCFSPEAVVAYLDQPRANDRDALALLTVLASEPSRTELLGAFATGSDVVRAGAALLGLRDRWEPDELWHAARSTMSLFSRDRRVGLEMLEVLAKEWHGTLEELGHTLRVLI